MDFSLLKVLSTDGLDKIGINLLKDAGIEVVEEKLTKSQLIERLSGFDAIIVRSATLIDSEIIHQVCKCKGNRLKIIARAGTGVDNIDMDAATECGLLVLNTPAANTLSAAEHTFALMCCLSRHIPQAYLTMKQGKWDRKSFMGTELNQKTLAIIGLGRIGREVASRAQAFGMKTIGYDPIVGKEEAALFQVDSMPLQHIWPQADYITIHVPLLPQTENLINLNVFKQCKKGVRVINCSRGGIVNEKDLLSALESGLCDGAALDVFTEEPPVFGDLINHPNVISTPHLGASTKEAQQRVAIEIADNLVSIANRSKFNGLVNGQSVNLLQNAESDEWQLLLSLLSVNLDRTKNIEIFYDDVTSFSKQRGFKEFIKGTLSMLLLKDSIDVNLVNADIYSKKNNIQILVSKQAKNYPLNTASLGIKVKGKFIEISVWKNQVYLTKYEKQNLNQPILLKKECNLLITNDKKTSSTFLARTDVVISSFYVDEGVNFFVTKGSIDNNISNEFEFVASF